MCVFLSCNLNRLHLSEKHDARKPESTDYTLVNGFRTHSNDLTWELVRNVESLSEQLYENLHLNIPRWSGCTLKFGELYTDLYGLPFKT